MFSFSSPHERVLHSAIQASKRYSLLLFLLPGVIFLASAVAFPSTYVGAHSLLSCLLRPHPPSPTTGIIRRQEGLPSSRTSPTPSPSSSRSGIPQAPTSSPTATGALPTPFPAAFDLSLSLNFTTAQCQSFFLNFTQSESFRRCRPFSLLFSSSSQFSQALNNSTLLTAILWGTCNTLPSEAECATVMNDLASTLGQACSTELKNKNVLASQAFTGFQMFSPMRDAGCLVDNKTGAYCFAEAAAAISPTDLYFWELPYGTGPPAGSVPTCSECVKDVMAIYAKVVTGAPTRINSTKLPLDTTYPQAALLAVKQCGSAYAQQVSADSSATSLRFVMWTFWTSATLTLLLGIVTLFVLI